MVATVIRPVQHRAIEAIHLNQGSEMPLLRLSDYIINPPGEESPITYHVTLTSGKALPPGLEYSKEGIISGRPEPGTDATVPYEVRVIAKNHTAVPLVVRFELYIHQSQVATGDISEDVVVSDALEEILQQREHLSEEEYNQLYLLYMVRKWGAIAIFDVSEGAEFYNETVIYEGSNGWSIYDDGSLLRTSNPQAVSSTFSTTGLINAMSEMIAIAASRGWKKTGVLGCDARLGYQLISEHNAAQRVKPTDQQQLLSVDNPVYASDADGSPQEQVQRPSS